MMVAALALPGWHLRGFMQVSKPAVWSYVLLRQEFGVETKV